MTATIPIVFLNIFATRLNVANCMTTFCAKAAYGVFLLHFIVFSFISYTYAEYVLDNKDVAKQNVVNTNHDLFFDYCEYSAISSTKFEPNVLFLGFVYTFFVTNILLWPFCWVLKKMPGFWSIL